MADLELTVDQGVATLRMQRPPVNAMTNASYQLMLDLFRQAGADPTIRCVVLSSATRCFSAGADLHELRDMLGTGDVEGETARRDIARELFTVVRTLSHPVIAAVNGPALGAGAVLAACCDIRVAGRSATFGLPEINAGRCGGGRHLMRVFPQGVVRRMYFTGVPISAAEAHRVGMVDVLCDDGDLADEVDALARLIASKSASALRLGKLALDACEEMDIDEGYLAEQSFTKELAQTTDALEAVRAFADKRTPVWTDQ